MKRQSYKNIQKIKELILEIGLLEKVKDKQISQSWIDIYTNFDTEVKKLIPTKELKSRLADVHSQQVSFGRSSKSDYHHNLPVDARNGSNSHPDGKKDYKSYINPASVTLRDASGSDKNICQNCGHDINEHRTRYEDTIMNRTYCYRCPCKKFQSISEGKK